MDFVHRSKLCADIHTCGADLRDLWVFFKKIVQICAAGIFESGAPSVSVWSDAVTWACERSR